MLKTNLGAYNGTKYLVLEIHRMLQLAWKRYKLAQAATKKMIMHIMEILSDTLQLSYLIII